MTNDLLQLAELGWSNHFHAQLSEEDWATHLPVRVLAVHRGRLDVAGPLFEMSVPPIAGDDGAAPTVGDWLLLERQSQTPIRVLHRLSLIKRKAAGIARRVQPIAANVDTLFVAQSHVKPRSTPW
jgi:ribosome biogenesis GTPase